MRCHYEVLGVTETASEDDLKKAYKKLALQWHPGSFWSMFRWLWTIDCLDKNPSQVAEAQRRFLEIRAAYEVLSDSRERAWYDAHRDVMLQKASGDDYQDDTINIYPFFTSSCYQGYNDSDTVRTLNGINASPLSFSRVSIPSIRNYSKILLNRIWKDPQIRLSSYLNSAIQRATMKKWVSRRTFSEKDDPSCRSSVHSMPTGRTTAPYDRTSGWKNMTRMMRSIVVFDDWWNKKTRRNVIKRRKNATTNFE